MLYFKSGLPNILSLKTILDGIFKTTKQWIYILINISAK